MQDGVIKKEVTAQSNEDSTIISASKAIEIASKFLEQYHTSVVFKFIVLEGQVWMIVIDVGMAIEEIRQVAVDANTGKILGYT